MDSRRHDPYPWTWEIPAVVGGIIICVVVFGVQLGRGLACLVSGAGWRWPAPGALIGSLGGVLGGDAGAGLVLPVSGVSSRLLLGWIVTVELLLFSAVLWSGYTVLVRWGPLALRGAASASEASRLLGSARLYRVRRIVRPDLYGRPRGRHLPTEGAGS